MPPVPPPGSATVNYLACFPHTLPRRASIHVADPVMQWTLGVHVMCWKRCKFNASFPAIEITHPLMFMQHFHLEISGISTDLPWRHREHPPPPTSTRTTVCANSGAGDEFITMSLTPNIKRHLKKLDIISVQCISWIPCKRVIPSCFILWKNSFSEISRKCILPNTIRAAVNPS